MLTQSEMDKLVMEAKKSLSDEQIKDAIKRCSYGGSPVDMCITTGCIDARLVMKGGDICNGKTNA